MHLNLQYTVAYFRIKEKDLHAIKIASYDSTSYPMLNNLKKLNLPFVISTGATNNSQIIKTSKFMNNQIFALLHCVTVYPTPLHLCNLSKIKFLKKFTPYVGWSDHTEFEKSRNSIFASSCDECVESLSNKRHGIASMSRARTI